MKIEVLFPEFCNLFGDAYNMVYLEKTLPEAEFIRNRRIHITGHQLPSSFVFLRSRRQEFFVSNTGYSFHIRRNIYLHINLSSLITVYSLSYILCPVSFPSFQDMSTHFLPLMQSPFT